MWFLEIIKKKGGKAKILKSQISKIANNTAKIEPKSSKSNVKLTNKPNGG